MYRPREEAGTPPVATNSRRHMAGPAEHTPLELVPRAGFSLEPGDTVRYLKPRGGWGAGYFRGWSRRGLALVEIPGRQTALRLEPEVLRPSNDRRMLDRRGRVERQP
jgi:hypothetical protein